MSEGRPVEIRLLGARDASVLDLVAEEVFDDPIAPASLAEFLSDPRHHLAVGLDRGLVVGFASGIHYVHPDKPAELFIHEVGVAPSHRRQGLAKRLVERLLRRGEELGCREAWVATEAGNGAARALYESAGGTPDAEPAVIFSFRLGGGASQ